MIRNISILGSTGSIGTQTLEVVSRLGDIRVWGLSANTNIDLFEQQIRKFKPIVVGVMDEKSAKILKDRIRDTDTRVVSGMDGLIEVSTIPQVEMVVTSVVGIIGLIPTIEAINEGKHIGLANKETLVTAGKIIMETAKKKNVSIIPVDSEHSAIFQCLRGNTNNNLIKRLLLTASGGPFLGKLTKELEDITPEQALKHPKWNMGSKISIDSATLMNKGLEVIEAKWLFDVDIDRIQVLIHPQSIIHSMVEYIDGSMIAQMGIPDMKIPIQYALTFPERRYSENATLDLLENNSLNFQKPDISTFRCLHLAFEAARVCGTMPVVLNAANEVAVQAFLDGKIAFLQIGELVEKTMGVHKNRIDPSLKEILEIDEWARMTVEQYIDRIKVK